jgi:NAD(P)-dependent dehydrogenase (short-subunit alcohol dehydrogenase family)
LASEGAPLGIHATVVEPGFFRTDFLDDRSLVRTAQEIEGYAATVGKTRHAAAESNHAQLGDPAKLARAMMVLAAAPHPPVRLPLGSDTVKRIQTKNAFVESELKTWRDLTLSTDWTDAA